MLAAVLAEAREKELLSAEHFSVDGTLIRAWAASRSFQEKSDPPAAGKGSGHGGEVLLRDKVRQALERPLRCALASNACFSMDRAPGVPLGA